MTRKEFITKMEDMLFEVIEKDTGYIYILDKGFEVAFISESEMYTMDTDWTKFRNLNNKVKSKLFSILVEYTSTPIEDRGGIKKYKLKFKPNGIDIGTPNNNNIYLNYRKELGDYIISNGDNTYYSQTIFTEQEVKDLDDKSNILSVFVKEEI